jgi:oxalate decarboxylase
MTFSAICSKLQLFTQVSKYNISQYSLRVLYLPSKAVGRPRLSVPNLHAFQAESPAAPIIHVIAKYISPSGIIDTFEVGPDQIVFVPAAYFHYIENNGDEELHLAVFFSHEKPQDMGVSGAFGSYSNEVLGAVFNMNPKTFESLPRYQEDLVAGGG